ncbi:MAG: phosphopyruvate hydratase [bacterium]|nr:phosphopyruvate hydratase [bacterium]MDZ4285793.1 phosphopyruvate hydratase [Candidatus Sungbacteria bacterium]
MKIKHIKAREILDSRGNPTVEVDVVLLDGSCGRGAVPSGASTGSHEAVELRDGGKRYMGKGVQKAVANVNTYLSKLLVKKDWTQGSLDQAMIAYDGTLNKSKMGANAILGVSLAFAHAVATSKKKPLYHYFKEISKTSEMILPTPMMNILNGGRHASGSTDLQEFMIVPVGAKTFAEGLKWSTEVYHALQSILSSKGFQTTVGDEGGFAPSLGDNESAVEIILEAIRKAGFSAGKDVAIALDAAATEFYINGNYRLASERRSLSSAEMVEFYADWVRKYPIISIEDGLAEDDWRGYELMTRELGHKIQIVGDDLFVTSPVRLEEGITRNACNSILIKLNQIGTVSETIDTMKMARIAGYACVVSHRSGETEDASIADFAVGLGTGQIKTGAPCRGERTAKYNQMLRIEEELGKDAVFLGKKSFSHL